jgi:cysteine desulfuration protein SufE
MSDIQSKLKEITNDLSYCDTREELFEYFMDLGKDIEDTSDIQTDDNFVPGCVSEVYIAGVFKEGLMQYQGTAGALIVKGYLALQLELFSGQKPQDIINAEKYILEFIKGTKIDTSALASRANAFGNIYLFIKSKAQKYV